MHSGLLLLSMAALTGGAAAVALDNAREANAFAQATLAASPVVDATDPAATTESVRIGIDAPSLSRAQDAALLPAGVKSLLRVPKQLEHGDFVWNETGAPATGKVTVFVDLRRQIVSVFRDGHEIGTAVVVYGGLGKYSPTGSFKILRKYRDYHSRTYDAPMPYSQFITNDGVALHGSPMAADRATHGCIGLPIEFARRLFEVTARGGTVQITRSQPMARRQG